MALPPIKTDRTAAGITVDPQTLERVVPTSRRKDGSIRKELKIRPGFTPQEDVGRFRGSRQQASDQSRSVIPGSTRTRPPPTTDNPFANANNNASGSQEGKTKAQLKNEKRRANKKATASKAWDESDDGSDDGDISEAFKAQAQGTQQDTTDGSGLSDSAKQEKELEDKKAKDQKEGKAWPAEDGGQGMISEATPDGGGAPESPIPIEPAVEDRKDQDEGETAILSPPPPGPAHADPAQPEWRTASSRRPKPTTKTSSSTNANATKPHPIQGGRQGPIGLAHPPPIESDKPTQRPNRQRKPSNKGKSAEGNKATSGATSKTESKTAAEPRVRKEVKVRDSGMGSLADRVKNLVIANQGSGEQKKKEKPAASTATPA